LRLEAGLLVALLVEAGFEILTDSELMPETVGSDVILRLLIEPVVDESVL
jgi:hypothetical protein